MCGGLTESTCMTAAQLEVSTTLLIRSLVSIKDQLSFVYRLNLERREERKQHLPAFGDALQDTQGSIEGGIDDFVRMNSSEVCRRGCVYDRIDPLNSWIVRFFLSPSEQAPFIHNS